MIGDKCKFQVFLSNAGLSNGFPLVPNEESKVTVGAQAAMPDRLRYYYPITAITTIDKKAGGAPYPFFSDFKARVIPVLTYKVSPTSADRDEAVHRGVRRDEVDRGCPARRNIGGRSNSPITRPEGSACLVIGE